MNVTPCFVIMDCNKHEPAKKDMSAPSDSHISLIEKTLGLQRLSNADGDTFINVHRPWQPSWGRGLYGGALIAQALLAAQATVSLSFDAHSLHCHFMLPARPDERIRYHVQRQHDGKNYALRIIHAKQREDCIFIATVSFTRHTETKEKLEHANYAPVDVKRPSETAVDESKLSASTETGDNRPCDIIRCDVPQSDRPYGRKLRHWIRARGYISNHPCYRGIGSHARGSVSSGQRFHIHLAAVAYMSDNYFIGTVARVHNARRFTDPRTRDRILAAFQGSEDEKKEMERYLDNLAHEEAKENHSSSGNQEAISMMASLNHTILFHNPRSFKADEWMLAEMETPWAGMERGLVVQRIWSRENLLIATCIQEGVVRLVQTPTKSRM